MKKIFTALIPLLLLTSMVTINPASADDDASYAGGMDDVMKYVPGVENAFLGQKITDEDFQKTLQAVKEKQNKRRKNKTPQLKGKNFNDETSGSYIKETAEKNLLLCIPLDLTNEDGIDIPIGHYKIVGEKVQDKVYLDFYQSSTLIAKVPATETNYDFNEAAINFVKLVPYNEHRVKVLYGSMDFNAYTFIKITPQEVQNENQ